MNVADKERDRLDGLGLAYWILIHGLAIVGLIQLVNWIL